MAKFRDILNYYRPYRSLAIFSIAAASFFEIVDLLVPYAIGQILNVLSGQPIDKVVQSAIALVANLTDLPQNKFLSLAVLLGLIFVVTVVRAPIQVWSSWWFHWYIALRSRSEQFQKSLEKILTLPLEFYDENNPGRIAGRVAKGLENHTWIYPEIAGQLIPKLLRILGISVVIWLIEWRIGLLFLVSFVLILSFHLKDLQQIIEQERRLDKYMENTQSRNSEIVTNIKTVKAFATEALELKRQRQRLRRELKVVLFRIHLGYIKLATLSTTVIQFCVFLVLGLTLFATVTSQISLGHFVTTLTVSSMAYAELEPISNLAELFARRYASILSFHEFMQQSTGSDAVNLLAHAIAIIQLTQ